MPVGCKFHTKTREKGEVSQNVLARIVHVLYQNFYISVKFFCALTYIQTPFPFESLAFHGRGRLYTGYVFFSKRNDEKTSQSMVNFFVQLVLCFCHQSLPQRFNIVLIIDDHCHFFLISLREQTVARDQ